MTDRPDPPNAEQSASMFEALRKFAPGAISAISAIAPQTATDTLHAQQATAPGYAALQNQITAQYGPEAARIGNEINNTNQLAGAQTEANLLKGPGQELISGALSAQQKLDPEYYQSRGTISKALNDYLGGYDPNRLSGSELEQINRGISGREGPLTSSALKTVQNAQTFGNAATQRWQNFGNAITQASAALPGLKSGLTGFEIATKRPLTSNSGEARLSSPTTPGVNDATNTNFGFANSALNSIAAQNAAIIGKTRSFDQRVNEAVTAAGTVI